VGSTIGRGAPLAFSPGAGSLLVGEDEGTRLLLYAYELSGGARTDLGTTSSPPGQPWDWRSQVLGVWGPHGAQVLSVRTESARYSIDVFSASSGSTHPLIEAESSLQNWRLAAGSSRGNVAAVWLHEVIPTSILSGYGRDHLYVVDLGTRQRTLLANHMGDTLGGSVAFSPNGQRIAFYYATREDGPPSGGIYLIQAH
jgi:hypothetical protein